MLPEDMVEAVNRMVSGIRAKDYVSSISNYHRIQASPGFHEAINYLKGEIEKVSDAKIEIFEYPADGKRQIETFVAPFGWFPSSGTLELIEPERKLLADFQAEPIHFGKLCMNWLAGLTLSLSMAKMLLRDFWIMK